MTRRNWQIINHIIATLISDIVFQIFQTGIFLVKAMTSVLVVGISVLFTDAILVLKL